MLSSEVHSFTDPGNYSAAIRATTIDLTVMGRGRFVGKRARIDFHRLWMLWLSENMAWTLHSAFVTGRATVTFRTHPGPRLLWGGVELQPSNIIRTMRPRPPFSVHQGRPARALCHCRWRTWYPSEPRWLELTLTPPKDPLILNLHRSR